MTITEPTTLLTDYALSLESGIFAVLLLKLWNQSKFTEAIVWWAIAFFCVAIAAFLGGTYHGFTLYLTEPIAHLLWQGVLFTISLASFATLTAAILHLLPHPWQPWLIALAALKLLLLHHWTILREDFAHTITEYLCVLLIVVLFYQLSPKVQVRLGSGWFWKGFLFSCLAALVQATQLNTYLFSHDDWYHLVQMVAMYCLWRGAIAPWKTTCSK